MPDRGGFIILYHAMLLLMVILIHCVHAKKVVITLN